MADRNEDLQGQGGLLAGPQGAVVIDERGAEPAELSSGPGPRPRNWALVQSGPCAGRRTFVAIRNGRRFDPLLTGDKDREAVPVIGIEAHQADNPRWSKGTR